jgi:hypothetical protein
MVNQQEFFPTFFLILFSSVSVGTCAVPIKKGEKLKTWVPVRSFTHTLEEQYAIYDNIEILVEIEVNLSMTDFLNSVNDTFSDVFTYNRPITGTTDFHKLSIPRVQSHRYIIADCYEWMWNIGFTGSDPLILDNEIHINSSTNNNKNPSSQESLENRYFEEDEDEGRYSEERGDPSLSDERQTSTEISQDPAKTFKSVSPRRNSSMVGRNTNRANLPDSDDEVTGHTDEQEDDLDDMNFETRKSVFDYNEVSNGRPFLPPPPPFPSSSSVPIPIPVPVKDQDSNKQFSPSTSLGSSPTKVSSISPTPVKQSSLSSANPSTNTVINSRLDYCYSLDWIKQHIHELTKFLEEIRSYLPDIKRKIRSERAFRSSVYKKEPLLQPLPTNLHYQLLGIRKHCVACVDAHPKQTEILHCLTSGALTPHVLGHKSGGLYHQESLLIKLKEEIRQKKENYLKKLKSRREENGIRIDSMHSPYHQLQDLGKSILEFEKSSINLGRRRMLAISQGLTIAINGLLLKLNLVISEMIPHQIANRWLESGFLIVFEGLLSVVGNERSMLEDTISAVDALRSFQVKFQQNVSQDGDLKEEEERRKPRNLSADSQSNSNDLGSQSHGIEFDMKGREIIIYMSEKSIQKLPQVYQQALAKDQLIIRFFPVLFTQVSRLFADRFPVFILIFSFLILCFRELISNNPWSLPSEEIPLPRNGRCLRWTYNIS